MVTRRLPPVAAGTAEDVEAQFYEALQQANIEALMRLWADDDEVVCVHPGGPRLVGPAAIRASFEAIFANGRIPVVPEQVRRLAMMGAALHHLVERIEVAAEGGATQTAYVLATNVYVKTPQGWRIAAHHASPATLNEASLVGDAPSTLH
jgi:uncharacterized protein (TIGR02246 family)